MKFDKFVVAATWLLATSAAFAEEEPYKTEVQITGKESGPYSIGAKVQPKKQPYKMDKSKDITNDDLGNIWNALSKDDDPLGIEKMKKRAVLEGLDIKGALDSAKSQGATENTTSSSPHPDQTEMIADPVEEIAPSRDATADAMEDARVRQHDASVARARQDMKDALDRMHSADADGRQRAQRDYDGAKQRLQDLSNAAP
ncbi:MAG: hypothetical protein K2Y22_15755 [Candidatus Obscuribacterales bacterium]|nr:hypothetical protein [Candidatus Obscuribacterales bacterium]